MDIVTIASKAVHEALSKLDVMHYLDMPHETAEVAARAALAAMLEAVGEPTQEMREAFVELALRVSLSREYTWGDYANDQWKVMLAASPLYSLAALREEV